MKEDGKMDDKEKKITQEETPKDNKIPLTEDETEKTAGGAEEYKPPKFFRVEHPYTR